MVAEVGGVVADAGVRVMTGVRVERRLNLEVCDEIVTITETVLLEVVTIEAVLVTKGNQVLLLRGWSNQYRRPITLAELDEINYNLAHFFSVMLSLENRLRQQGLIPEAGESQETHV